MVKNNLSPKRPRRCLLTLSSSECDDWACPVTYSNDSPSLWYDLTLVKSGSDRRGIYLQELHKIPHIFPGSLAPHQIQDSIEISSDLHFNRRLG